MRFPRRAVIAIILLSAVVLVGLLLTSDTPLVDENEAPKSSPPVHSVTALPVVESRKPSVPEAKYVKPNTRQDMVNNAIAAYLDQSKYPPFSRRPTEDSDQFVLQPIRSARTAVGSLSMTTEQDAVFLSQGELSRIALDVEGASSVSVSSMRLTFLDGDSKESVLGVLPLKWVSAHRWEGVVAAPRSQTGRLLAQGTLRAGSAEIPVVFAFTVVKESGRFTGKIREEVEAGSLVFYAGIELRNDGHYLIKARLYDAHHRPVAWMMANEMLKKETAEVRLVGFGKLLHDAQAVFPLTVEDIEGIELLERGFPDRLAFMPLLGPVHQTASYALNTFSPAEWDSPDKQAYLKGLRRQLK